MNSTSSSADQMQACQRLRQQVDQDGGTQHLSPTDLAFYQTFCDAGNDALPGKQAAELGRDNAIDESAHIPEGTLFGDPNAGRPDDPADANPR